MITVIKKYIILKTVTFTFLDRSVHGFSSEPVHDTKHTPTSLLTLLSSVILTLQRQLHGHHLRLSFDRFTDGKLQLEDKAYGQLQQDTEDQIALLQDMWSCSYLGTSDKLILLSDLLFHQPAWCL